MIELATVSGSIYLLDQSNKRIKRLSEESLRRDSEWLFYSNEVNPVVGEKLVIELEPLSIEAEVTLRVTTEVFYLKQV